jgi:hypothetical protein
MPVQPVSPALLRCHRDSPAGIVESIKAFPRMEGRVLTVTYVLSGDVDRLRVPPAKRPGRSQLLWQHTCFEAFIAAKNSPAYYEFNFSPSGEWAAYSFRAYRDGAAVENDLLEPGIAVRRQADTLELMAHIRLNHLPALAAPPSLRLGLAAVIEDCEGRYSYWALWHPPGSPDFHDRDSFILHFSRR